MATYRALITLLTSLSLGLSLDIESNVDGLIDNVDFQTHLSTWADSYTLGGANIDYIGVFNADIAVPEWNVSSVADYILDTRDQASDNGTYYGLDITNALSNLGSGLAIDSADSVGCANPKCLTKRDGYSLKLKRDHAEIDRDGCDVMGRFIPVGSGVVFAIIGAAVCTNPAGIVGCSILLGGVGGLLGDIGKDLFVEKCKGQAEEARNHCHEHQSSTSCARNGKDLTFGRIFHKGKKYGCKKLKAGEEGKVHCRRIKA